MTTDAKENSPYLTGTMFTGHRHTVYLGTSFCNDGPFEVFPGTTHLKLISWAYQDGQMPDVCVKVPEASLSFEFDGPTLVFRNSADEDGEITDVVPLAFAMK